MPTCKSSSLYKIFNHLTALAPYYITDTQSLHLPPSFKVDKTAYLFRHAVIYANKHDYDDIIQPFLLRLKSWQNKANARRNSKLDFLHTYESKITDDQIGQISGIGRRHAKQLGGIFAKRYPEFLTGREALLRLWASEATRCIDTAVEFGRGFCESHGNAEYQIIRVPETIDNEDADNLSPHLSFPLFNAKTGTAQSLEFAKSYTATLITKFNQLQNGFKFTMQDIIAMQLLCGYEVVTHQHSPFEALFDPADWAAFEYMNDIKYYYSQGYGSKGSAILAFPWLKAVANNFNLPEGSGEVTPGNIFISFSHREEILFLATALGLFNDGPNIPSTLAINKARKWRTSEIVPGLGHIGLEKIRDSNRNEYVRVIVNGSVMDNWGGKVQQGPGGSCPVKEFNAFIDKKSEEYRHFWDERGKMMQPLTFNNSIRNAISN
jgi:acid phosphatase